MVNELVRYKREAESINHLHAKLRILIEKSKNEIDYYKCYSEVDKDNYINKKVNILTLNVDKLNQV